MAGQNRDTHLLIITGASSGIGKAMAAAATADGAMVATVSRRPGPGDHLAADLGDPNRWAEVVEWMSARISQAVADGATKVSFVHNAGVLDPIGFAGEVDADAYQNNVLVNAASGQVLGSGFIESVNAADPDGRLDALVVMVSSGAGKRPFTGWSSYCAAKSALDMWTRCVALEQAAKAAEGARPVVAVSIGPGVVDTDMQGVIRGSSASGFPDVERFRDLKSSGALASPESVGAAYWEVCNRSDLEPGTVSDISELVPRR